MTHLWSDVTFKENLESNYPMLSYTNLGKPSEDIIYYQSMLCPGVYELSHGSKFPVLRNCFTIAEMIEEYQDSKKEIDSYAGVEYPVDIAAYIAAPYLILRLASDLQAYNGWLEDGYPYETYTLTEISRILGAYN